MPNSTHNNRREALTRALADCGPLRYTDDTDVLDNYAANIIRDLQNGGWNLVHADDLPAGYVPGDALSGSPTALRYPFLTYGPDPLTYHPTGPVAISGSNEPEPTDEMRRRLPTTNPTTSRDQDPFAQSPQETTQAVEIREILLVQENQGAEALADRNTLARLLTRTTTLEERASDHDARIDHYTAQSDTNARAIDSLTADRERHEAMITDLDGRLSALEITTRNVTEMRRELDDLRQRTAPDARDQRYATLNAGAPDDARGYMEGPRENMSDDERQHHEALTTPNEDPDTQLGGHDNPNPTTANEHDNADDSNA